MTPERLSLLWGITVFSGALAQALAWISGLPGVVLLLAVGLVIGRSGLHLVEPLDLGMGLETVVGLLVSLVLFDGGINLRLPGDALKRTVLRIVVVRLLVAVAGGMVAAHLLAGLSWSLAAVFGAIVLATGPTVVNPLVRQIRLREPLGQVLEGEGLVLEPIGAVLALLLLELVLGNLQGWRELVLGLIARLGGGVAIGVATVAAGVVVGRRLEDQASALDDLIRQLAMLAITMLFPLLAADVSWQELSPLGWGGVACVLGLMLLQRPLAIGLATWGLPFDLRDKVLLAWLAPRGIVTAAIASLFAIRLEQAGVLGAGRLQGLVFLTILMTVGLQGLSAGPLAARLGLVADAADECSAAEPATD